MAPPDTWKDDVERRPLLSPGEDRRPSHDENNYDHDGGQKVEFGDKDSDNPREWSSSWKMLQTLQIFIIAFVCPMSSSIIASAIDEIQTDFHTTKKIALLGQTGFVCMLGIGPLFHAPMSETLGRRPIFLLNLAIFTVLQLFIALCPNVASFIVFRTFSGFFGSVGVANGGGTISDLFEKHSRAVVLGVYLIAPLLGTSVGPLFGALIVASRDWRWIFWLTLLLSGLATIMSFFFLYESQAITILQHRKSDLEKKHPDSKFVVEGSSDQSVPAKIATNSTRAVRILFTQPIVLIMSLYQAFIFSSMYSLYALYNTIFSSPPYNFNKTQVGLTYLGPTIGFLFTAVFTVFFIDRVYNYFAAKNNDDGQPEYRLPMANVGAVLLPISLFWFGWTVQKQLPWPVPLTATLLFGASQVSIFNTVQTYYIDSFESNAASALAAGSFLRSIVGGIVPLFISGMFETLGYGWGMSVFGGLSLILMPAPALFYWYGRTLREKYPFKP